MLHLVLAVVPRWCILCHVPYIGILVFPERWNSSCSSLKGLITSQRSSPPLYESARKAEQAEGQQRQPAYSKARDAGGDNITVDPHHKKDNTVTRITQNTHMRMVSKHMRPYACKRSLSLSATHMHPHALLKCNKLHKGHIMQHYIIEQSTESR